MRLLSALQSILPCASARGRRNETTKDRRSVHRTMPFSLLVAKSLYRIEARRPRRRIQPGEETHNHRKPDCSDDQPPRNRPDLFGRKMLPLEIDVGEEIDHLTNRPSQSNSDYPAQHTHDSRLC